MNCRRARNRILLTQSGESTQLGWKMLRRHLVRCPACRAYNAETGELARRAARELSMAEPAAAALAAVGREIRRSRTPASRGMRFLPLRASMAGVGLAAALLLTFAWLTVRNGSQAGRIEQMRALISLMEEAGLPEATIERGDGSALRALGIELLRSQGLWAGDEDGEV